MSDKDILQDTSRYQEILNTIVGSKIYYMFQEEVHKVIQDIQLGNKIALDETLQFLWWEYVGNSENNEELLNKETSISDLWFNVDYRLDKEKLVRPSFIEADTFEEFLKFLKELKFEKNG